MLTPGDLALMVPVVAGDAIQAIAGFQDASLFDAFGLPQTMVSAVGRAAPQGP